MVIPEISLERIFPGGAASGSPEAFSGEAAQWMRASGMYLVGLDHSHLGLVRFKILNFDLCHRISLFVRKLESGNWNNAEDTSMQERTPGTLDARPGVVNEKLELFED
jgi:hypothetical protein